MTIISSFTIGAVQIDGKTTVIEQHVDTDSPEKILRKEYTAFIEPEHPEYVNPDQVMQLRHDRLVAEAASAQRASLISASGHFGLNKYEFRKLFTAAEQDAIDTFNEGGYLTHPALTEAQKGDIRRALAGYNATPTVQLDNEDTIAMVNLFEALGLLSTGRALEILNG